MNFLTPIAQLLAFLIELAAITAYAYWGFSFDNWLFKLVLGLGAPAIVVIIWAKWCAPRSETRLKMPWLAIVELIVFSIAALVMYSIDHKQWGIIIGAAGLLSVVLSIVTKQFDAPKL